MARPDGLLADLADAILDGRPIDWASVDSSADDKDRPLLDPFRLLASLADVHRPPLSQTPERTTDRRGEVIGAYRLIEPLGCGGMGEVYLAERMDGRFEQKVAVKLVKSGMDSVEILQRFARERRILARLEHPGIARLLDGGETSDGRPYFVMERVEGEPVTGYCRTRGVPLEDRLRLFAACCDAVDAAHRGLIVHRDLKPSNILVTRDGRVKLLDFGIARLLAEDEADVSITRHGGHIVTPGYAAPEQILGGGLTTATDVFALGVVLYELLTGTLPFDRRAATPHELSMRVERETAVPPSAAVRRITAADGDDRKQQRWERRLRGDLDTITTKALAHEPQRRYPSAAALAEDVRRYLTSRPVVARPDSTGYRLRKFVMRHRFEVAASGAVTAAVVVALVVSLAQTAAARRQAERAAAAQAFLVSLFEQIDPDRYAGSAPTVRDLLERGSERLDRELAQQPELRAEMQALLGQVFDQLSLPKQGEAHWRRAVETRQALFGPDDARTAKAKKGLAISVTRQARYSEAESIFQELLEHKQVRANERELGSVLLNYGNHKRLTGDYAGSEALLRRAVEVLDRVDPGSASLARALTNLGLTYWRQERERDAIPVLERALAIHMKNQGSHSNLVARTRKDLSHLHRDVGELDKAERYGREALEVAEKLFPPHHPFIGTTLESLGQIAEKRGDRAGARALYERSIASYAGSPRPDDPGIAFPLRYLAGLLLEEGEGKRAVELYERALAVRRKAFGDRHRDVAESWQDLARGRLAVGDVRGALEAIRTGVDTFRRVLPDSPQLARALVLLGDVLRRNGQPVEAVSHLEEAQAIFREKPPRNPRDLADLEASLVAARAALR